MDSRTEYNVARWFEEGVVRTCPSDPSWYFYRQQIVGDSQQLNRNEGTCLQKHFTLSVIKCAVRTQFSCNLISNQRFTLYPDTRHATLAKAHSKRFDKPCTALKPWPGTAGESVGAKWRKLFHSLVGVKLCYEGLNESASFDGAKGGDREGI